MMQETSPRPRDILAKLSRFFGFKLFEKQKVPNFETPFEGEPQPFIEGGPVSRDNFTSFLSKTFEVSMGNPLVQLLYIQYLDQKFETGGLASFTSFLKTDDPFNALSQREKDILVSDYKKVRAHAIMYQKSVADDTYNESDFSIADKIRAEFLKLDEFSLRSLFFNPGQSQDLIFKGETVLSWENLKNLDAYEAKKYLSSAVMSMRGGRQ